MSLSTKSLIHEGAIRVARKDVDVRCTRMSRPWMPGSRLLYGGLASPFPDSGPVSRVRGILSMAGKTRWVAGFTQRVAGTYVHSNRSCRLPPAHQGMKNWGIM